MNEGRGTTLSCEGKLQGATWRSTKQRTIISYNQQNMGQKVTGWVTMFGMRGTIVVVESLKKTLPIKGIVGVCLAAVILVVASFIPASEQLNREGVMGLAIMAVAVVLWICETFPAGLSGLLVLVLAAVFDVVPITQVFSGFGGPTIFFIIGVFSLTILMMKTNLGQRLTRRLAIWAGSDSKKLILAFMIGTTLISSIMTDTGAVIIVVGLALPLLESIGHHPGKSNLGKCIIIGIAFSAIFGGFCTPVGHSMNVLGMGMLVDYGAAPIGFLQWSLIGIPLAIVMIPLSWFIMIKVLKPEAICQDDLDIVLNKTKDMGKFSATEKKALAMIIIIPALWILGNWIPILNTTTVAIIGLTIMFLPGIDLLTWDDMQKEVPWNIILMVGAILSLGGIINSTGGAAFLANVFLSSGVMNLDPLLVMMLFALIAYLLHTVLPVAPAIIAILVPPLFAYADAVGISPAIPMLLIVLMVSGNFLLPLNPTITVAYGKGYFSFSDLSRTGVIPAIALVVIGTVWIYFMGGLLGV